LNIDINQPGIDKKVEEGAYKEEAETLTSTAGQKPYE
jgi:hypothetical protein